MEMTPKTKALTAVLAALSLAPFAAAAFSRKLAVGHCRIVSELVNKKTRLLLLTDLHSSYYGEGQCELIRKIEQLRPDVILLGGDICDDEVPHTRSWQLLSYIGKRFRCFYVSGNHELWSDEPQLIIEHIKSFGITVLENEVCDIELNGAPVSIYGLSDPRSFGIYQIGFGWVRELNRLSNMTDKSRLNILLSHRPEGAPFYRDTDFDLIMCGHAHGGQVRIPHLINGLYAPNQGIFPRYAGGIYDLGKNVMLVSRGLCKDFLPRVFNRPEIVAADIFPRK